MDRLSLPVVVAEAMLLVMGMVTVTVLRLPMVIHKGNQLAANGPSTLKTPMGLMERLFLHLVCQHTLAFHPTVRPTDTNLATPSPLSPKKARPKW